MKKTLSLALTFVMVLSFLFSLPLHTLAAPGDKTVKGQLSDTSRQDGGTVYWSLTYNEKNGTASLAITGDGYMPNALYDETWHYQLPDACYITSLTIGEGIKSIMNGAFSGESEIKYVELPESLEIIGDAAFFGTSIESIDIPSNVEKVSVSMFEPTAIKNINVSENNPYLKSSDGVVYSKDGKTLVAFPVARFSDSSYKFSIPETVEEIGEYAFVNAVHKAVVIPDSVKRICQFAFAGNVNLSSVSMSSNIEYIEDNAFFSCDSLTKIYLPETLKRIEYGSVGCVYELYIEDIYAVLNDAGVTYDPNDIYSLVIALAYLEYSIDQFIGVEVKYDFTLIAPEGSVGENHANRLGMKYVASPCCPAVISKAESDYNGVKLTWTKSSDALGYNVLRKTSTGRWEIIYSTTNPDETVYTDKTAKYSTNEYKVKAYNANGEAADIAESVVVRHYKQALPISAVNTTSGVKFTFSEGDLAKKYYIYRKAEGEKSYTRLDILSDGELSFVDTNVKNGVKYTYTVRGYDGEKLCPYDSVGVSCTYVTAPKITVANVSNGVTVKWSKNSKATSYSIYRKTGSGDSVLIKTAEASDSSYIDTSVKSGTNYKYYVKANIGKVKSACYSSSSQNIKFLSMPSVKVDNKGSGVNVTWSKVSGATGYYVYRRVPGGSWSRIYTPKSGSTVSYTDKSVKNGKKYEYTVKAVNGKYTSTYIKDGVTALFISTPKLKSVKSTRSGVTFTYSSVSGCDGYYIYRKTANGSWVKIATVKGASKVSYTDKTARKGVTYTYTVRAFDGSFKSSYYQGLKIKDKY